MADTRKIVALEFFDFVEEGKAVPCPYRTKNRIVNCE
jgi:hypothetical protein